MTKKERILALYSAFPDAPLKKIARIAQSSVKTVKYHVLPGYKERQHKRNLACATQKIIDVKKRLVDFLGGRCEKCGYNKNAAALHFHHKDPTQKLHQICDLLTGKFENALEEAKKCELLCANCHSEFHNE